MFGGGGGAGDDLARDLACDAGGEALADAGGGEGEVDGAGRGELLGNGLDHAVGGGVDVPERFEDERGEFEAHRAGMGGVELVLCLGAGVGGRSCCRSCFFHQRFSPNVGDADVDAEFFRVEEDVRGAERLVRGWDRLLRGGGEPAGSCRGVDAVAEGVVSPVDPWLVLSHDRPFFSHLKSRVGMTRPT